MQRFVILMIATMFIFFSYNTVAQTATKVESSNKEIKWLGWTEGFEKGNKEGKVMLIDAYTDWCGWCKRMDKDTYSNPEVIDYINANFVPIKFNPEIENVKYNVEGQELNGMELYSLLTQGKSHGFPTTYFLLPKQKSMMYDQGYRNAKDFMDVLKKVAQDAKQ
jgi:uncharacterized protein YyaL (SSP411 family)